MFCTRGTKSAIPAEFFSTSLGQCCLRSGVSGVWNHSASCSFIERHDLNSCPSSCATHIGFVRKTAYEFPTETRKKMPPETDFLRGESSKSRIRILTVYLLLLDVHAFIVVVLEVFTRRQPQKSFAEATSLQARID